MYSVYFYVETIKKLHAPRQYWILDWIPRRGFRIQGTGFQFLSVKLGPCIPIFSGIPDSLSCIPDSKAQDSGFHKQKFPLHKALTWGDLRVSFIIIKDGEKPKNVYFEAHDCSNYPGLARTAVHWCGKFNKKRSMKKMSKNLLCAAVLTLQFDQFQTKPLLKQKSGTKFNNTIALCENCKL